MGSPPYKSLNPYGVFAVWYLLKGTVLLVLSLCNLNFRTILVRVHTLPLRRSAGFPVCFSLGV